MLQQGKAGVNHGYNVSKNKRRYPGAGIRRQDTGTGVPSHRGDMSVGGGKAGCICTGN